MSTDTHSPSEDYEKGFSAGMKEGMYIGHLRGLQDALFLTLETYFGAAFEFKERINDFHDVELLGELFVSLLSQDLTLFQRRLEELTRIHDEKYKQTLEMMKEFSALATRKFLGKNPDPDRTVISFHEFDGVRKIIFDLIRSAKNPHLFQAKLDELREL